MRKETREGTRLGPSKDNKPYGTEERVYVLRLSHGQLLEAIANYVSAFGIAIPTRPRLSIEDGEARLEWRKPHQGRAKRTRARS